MSILSFIDLSYSYNQKKTVFKGLNAELELGKIYAILGSSGCGKTTLLSLLGGLDSPTKGKIFFNGEDITEKGLAYHRRNHVSFIFQSYTYKCGEEFRNMSYGYLWWIVDENKHIYSAIGNSGNVIYVNPSNNIVIAITSYFKPTIFDRIDFVQKYIEPFF